MKLEKSIFREYDIRGIYNEEMDEETAYHIGRAYGTKLREFGKDKTVLAHDNRLSSPILAENMIKGLVDSGIEVLNLGLATTPMCYFAANHFKTDASMMITASHNPKEYNGFKICGLGDDTIYGEEIQDLRKFIEEGKFSICSLASMLSLLTRSFLYLFCSNSDCIFLNKLVTSVC